MTADKFFVDGLSGALLRRRAGEFDVAWHRTDNTWHRTDIILDYMVGSADEVEPVSEYEARRDYPAAFPTEEVDPALNLPYRIYYVHTRFYRMLMVRRNGGLFWGDWQWREGTWQKTPYVMDYWVGKDMDVDDVTEEQARSEFPDAFEVPGPATV